MEMVLEITSEEPIQTPVLQSGVTQQKAEFLDALILTVMVGQIQQMISLMTTLNTPTKTVMDMVTIRLETMLMIAQLHTETQLLTG